MLKVIIGMCVVLLSSTSFVAAQELVLDTSTQYKAQVQQILKSQEEFEPVAYVTVNKQLLRVEILEGPKKGSVIEVENDYGALAVGDVFYLVYQTNAADGTSAYFMGEPYRLNTLIILTILFVVLVIFFGGWQGLRGLVSFVGGMFVIVYVLFPGIIAGYSPVALSISVASIIIIFGSYITHGFNKTTSCAVAGMVLAIVFTGVIAHFSIYSAHLSGVSSEGSIYLNADTQGRINFVGLLLGGMIIGLLGVLYDAAIGQAVAVAELHAVAPSVSRRIIFKRASRIGREHIGALMNSLAIAYVGASLPLLLLVFHSYSSPFPVLLNMEIISAEVIRTLVGSIGLVLAVPLTTLIAVFFLVPSTAHSRDESTLDGHHHGHHH